MLQMIVILAVFVALIIPLGTYLYHIAERKHTFADPVYHQVIFQLIGNDLALHAPSVSSADEADAPRRNRRFHGA